MGRITASMLYNLIQCPHRVTLDLFGRYEDRDPVSPFVQLLWEKGTAFEKEVIDGLAMPFTDLSTFRGEEKEGMTKEAMERGDGLIYSGRITAGDLVGEPDMLRRQGSAYVAGDIKSGAGEEGASENSEGRPKKHYAVQLALYTDILERLGCSGGRIPFVWDVHGEEVPYALEASRGVKAKGSLWDLYEACLEDVRAISLKGKKTLPALGAACKLCCWRTMCKKELKAAQDLTLIPELGREKRDVMIVRIRTLPDLAAADISALIRGRKTLFPGIGPDSLRKFQERARLLLQPGGRPYIKKEIALPDAGAELFFDIETDPMRDVCYLHGFLERRAGTEHYVSLFAESPAAEDEERAFARAWQYVQSAMPCVIYYYSPYERTLWRKLRERYPHVASEEQMDELFAPHRAVDLYTHVVKPCMEWPTNDHSIKTLASWLGFTWRDMDPSGAASIEWYHRWVERGDEAIRRRILQYNEDDCIATRVLLDGIKSLL
ncbi:MAG: TM0106 family RecB-like putative nuclease [Nitrospiraceae bacterium]|nr:MAG: TM0106 family RecB-like putative nuclease [Nitrospiraceae bacterium]